MDSITVHDLRAYFRQKQKEGNIGIIEILYLQVMVILLYYALAILSVLSNCHYKME